jgi:SAM-dependent methyltransferase
MTEDSYARQPVMRCDKCGFSRLRAAGRSDYWDNHQEDVGAHYWTAARSRYFAGALDLLETMAPGRRLLDVGGGPGVFSEIALARGWDAISLDVSERATAAASLRIGADRSIRLLAGEAERSFDAVTLWCVIAHVPDARPVVEIAARALRPGGIVWLTTPNLTFQRPYAAVRRMFRRPLDWARDDHVGHFTEHAVRMVLAGSFSDVRFHHVGITETCIATGTTSGAAVAAKRAWNAAAAAGARLGGPSLVSELQATGIRLSTAR